MRRTRSPARRTICILFGQRLKNFFGVAEEAALTWKPQNTVPVGEDKVQQLFKLLEAGLEDNDDVQTVSGQFRCGR